MKEGKLSPEGTFSEDDRKGTSSFYWQTGLPKQSEWEERKKEWTQHQEYYYPKIEQDGDRITFKEIGEPASESKLERFFHTFNNEIANERTGFLKAVMANDCPIQTLGKFTTVSDIVGRLEEPLRESVESQPDRVQKVMTFIKFILKERHFPIRQERSGLSDEDVKASGLGSFNELGKLLLLTDVCMREVEPGQLGLMQDIYKQLSDTKPVADRIVDAWIKNRETLKDWHFSDKEYKNMEINPQLGFSAKDIEMILKRKIGIKE